MRLKRIISTVLTLAVCASMWCGSGITVDAASSDFFIKNGVLIAYNGPGGDVVIPDGVTSIGAHAFEVCCPLTSVTIPDSVTSIGESAFSCCDNLHTVTIPKNVTSIGDGAFCGCYFMVNISVDSGNKSYKSINGVLFTYDGSRLISYPSDLENTSYTIPSGVVSIGNEAFSESRISDLTICNSVTSIGNGAFMYCEKLTNLAIPSSVTSFGDDMFEGCSGFTSIVIPSNFKSIPKNTFSYCKNLASVTIPDSVTSIGDSAFSDCKNLTSVTIPDSVKSIGGSAFEDCTSITSVVIPSSVTSIGRSAFGGTPWLKNCSGDFVVVGSNVLLKYNGSGGAVTIPSGITSIAGGTFSGYTSITSVTIPNGVKSIGDITFYGCKNMDLATIPNSVNSIGEFAFDDCSKLTILCAKGSCAESYAKSHRIKCVIDSIKPAIKVSIGNGKAVVTVTDANLLTKSVTLNGKAIAWPKSNTFTAKGSYSVTAMDKAGNTSTAAFKIK